MRGVVLAGIFALIAFLAWWWPAGDSVGIAPATSTRTIESPEASSSAESTTAAAAAIRPDATPVKRAAQPPVVAPAMAQLAHELHAPDATGADDLEILQSLVTFYRRANDGEGPSGGLNHEIVADLRGANAHAIAVLPGDLASLSPTGELLDRWGTAYHFHPISRTVLGIRSAGPDRKLWTPDDIESGSNDSNLAQGLSSQ